MLPFHSGMTKRRSGYLCESAKLDLVPCTRLSGYNVPTAAGSTLFRVNHTPLTSDSTGSGSGTCTWCNIDYAVATGVGMGDVDAHVAAGIPFVGEEVKAICR